MKEKIARFMYGRYGVDHLCRLLVTIALVLLLISAFAGSNVLYLLSLGILVYAYYRAFSRNLQARYREAASYERLKNKVKGLPRRLKESRTHKIFKCPGCSQKIRIPRHKGNIEITCPKCKTTFRGKS